MTIFNIILVQVFLPLLFLTWLWKMNFSTRTLWFIQTVATGSFILLVLVIGAWGWTSFYMATLLLLLFITALIKSIRRLPSGWGPAPIGNTWSEIIFGVTHILVAVIAIPLSVFALSGYTTQEEPVQLQFPLQNGVYHVAQGGANPVINYHNVYNAQMHAQDIGKLNVLGTRAYGFYPNDRTKYAIYDELLYSPCTGTVQHVESNQPDHNPPERNPEVPAGNHIVIDCNSVLVYLAHMIQGSIMVNIDDEVEAGDPVGRAGNSGNTTEPHLHIHAERDGVGVPIVYDGRFLVRNSIVWR